MHFPIISLEDMSVDKADFMSDIDYEDSVLNAHTDYYGEIYTEEERRRVICSRWLADLLFGIATIDTEAETITFLDAETIESTMRQYYIEITKRLYEQAEDGELRLYDLEEAAECFRGCDALFYKEYGMTSMMFVREASYYAGQTLKFGNIFDAHY